MSSQSNLSIGTYCVSCVDDHIDGEVLELFRESELVSSTSTDDGYEKTTRCFYAPAFVVRDRLDIMGLTVKRAREEFEDAIIDIASEFEDEPLLIDYNFDRGRELVAEIKQNPYDFVSSSPLLQFFLEPDELPGPFTLDGFPLIDPRLHLRAALEEFEHDVSVSFFLDDMYEPDREIHDYVDSRVEPQHLSCVPDRRLIVLTEGSSDVHVLRGALEILFPHLIEFVSFMDFQSTRAAGGATELVKLVKAFAAAGIANHVVAVFDNDTAAAEAIKTLGKVTLPATIRCIQLPRLALATRYPALSPTGVLELADVNGCAGSIEMYFGESVLRGSEGNLVPVRWQGYNESLKRYQAELPGKSDLQARFLCKVKECTNDRSKFVAAEWEDMRQVLTSICFAFN